MSESRVRHAGAKAGATIRRNRPWLEPFSRFGYTACGVVYLLVGLLAGRLAFGLEAESADPLGALREVLRAPLGRIALVPLGVGLVGYAVWRLVQALLDTEGRGTGARGVAIRASQLLSCVAYAWLALAAARLVLEGGGGGSSDQTARDWSATLLVLPGGTWPLVAVGVLGVFAGLTQLYRASGARFRDQLEMDRLAPTARAAITVLGSTGLVARGVVFALVGWSLLRAAVASDPAEARGLSGVLADLAGLPAGPWVLGALAVGLAAYGASLLLAAPCRRMPIG